MGRNQRKREEKFDCIDSETNIQNFQQVIVGGKTREVADFILRGIQVNRRLRFGNKPLHEACTVKDNADVIRLLVNAGANVNSRNNYGNTPLHLVVETGICDDVQQLIDCGADVSIKNLNEDTPLHILCLQVTKINCWSVIELDKRRKTLKTELETLEKGQTLDGEERYIRTMDNVRVLLKAGAEVNVFNSTGETALDVASSSSSYILVKMLLRHGADVEVRDKTGYTPLLTSCRSYVSENNALPTACLLIEHGADVTVTTDVTRKTCLHLLAASSRFYYKSLMELVVEKGCPLDARDQTGSTALHIACKHPHRGHVTVLLSMHPDVTVLDETGRSAFSYFDQKIFDETSPIVWFLRTDLDFSDYTLNEVNFNLEGLVFLRWAECITPESVWPEALYTDNIRDPLPTCQIILSSQPLLSLNVNIKTSKINVCTQTTHGLYGMNRGRRPDLRILNSTEIPTLKVFSRAVIRRNICPGRSLLPRIKSFLSQVNLPRSVSEFTFLYAEAMTVFRNDGYELRKLFPYSS